MVSAGSHHGEEELGGALALALRHRALQQQERRRGREDVRTQLLLPVAVVSREDDVKRYIRSALNTSRLISFTGDVCIVCLWW